MALIQELSQAANTATAGVGILSIIIQGGSFALLAYLLIKVAPKAIQRHDIAQTERERIQSETVDKMVEAFKAEQKYEREQCTTQFNQMMQAQHELSNLVGNGQKNLSQAIGELANSIHASRRLTEVVADKIVEKKQP